MTPFVNSGCSPGVSDKDNVTINAQQCRAKTDVVIPKPPGVFRIFFIGGSAAYGTCSPSDDRIIGAYLERFLNAQSPSRSRVRFEVLTFATPAWTSTHERIVVENRLVDLAPDLVISYSGSNDIHFGFHGTNVFWMWTQYDQFALAQYNRLRELCQRPCQRDVSLTEARPPAEELARRVYRNVYLSRCALSLSRVPYLYILQPNLMVSKKCLTEREQAITRGADWSMGRIPGVEEYYRKAYREISDILSPLVSDNTPGSRFYFASFASVFDDVTQDIFIDNVHYGDRGNEKVASAVLDKIVSDSIIETRLGDCCRR
ncbi:MAG: SGNH/GDSL hydrolase family protein [Thermoguttaceae bacterium]|jgi:lysophospholipase L1-like esterase